MLATACTVALGTASVPVLAAEINVEAGVSTEVETPSTETETGEQTPAQVAEPKLSITANTTTFDGTQDIVLTLKAEFDGSVEFYQDMVTLDGVIVGNVPEQVSDKEMRITVTKDGLQRAIAANHYENGQTSVLSTGYSVGYRDESGVEQEVAFPTITLTYSTGDTDNGGDNNNGGDNGNNGGDNNGNGGTENPDPEQPETPDNGNGDNNGNTETPDNSNGDNTQKPDDNKKPDDQKPITGQTVKPAKTNTNTNNSPKTADMTAVLPVLGTGITSLGVAVAAIFKRRK